MVKKYMSKDIKNLNGLDIVLWYSCNVNCNFCFQKDLRLTKPNLTKDTVIDIINKSYTSWNRYVIFSGWEPTLDSNLWYYIRYAKKIGYYVVRVHTNGNKFKNFDYLYSLYSDWLDGITISIHWYWWIHDCITKRKWSFDIINKSLKNFEKLHNLDKNFIYDINTVISKDNVWNLLKYFLYIKDFNFNRTQFVTPYTLNLFWEEEKKSIIASYELFINEIKKILVLSLKYNKKIVLDNIPYCIIWDKFKWSIFSNLKLNQSSYEFNDWFVDCVDEEEVAPMHKSINCKNCKYFKVCRWIPKEYFEIYGDYILKPIYD